MTISLYKERVEVKSSEFLKVDSVFLNNFQSLCVDDLERLEGSGVQVNL